jgi:hypothetical protein
MARTLLLVFGGLLSALIFYIGYRLGTKTHEGHESIACPTSTTSSSTTTASIAAAPLIEQQQEQQPCPEITSSPMCPIYPTSLANLATLHKVKHGPGKATVPEMLFPHLKHPSTPEKWFFTLSKSSLTSSQDWDSGKPLQDVADCEHVYLTRTGSFSNQPNKCVAVAVVAAGTESSTQLSHRYGHTALKTDQYQEDFPRGYGTKDDNEKVGWTSI